MDQDNAIVFADDIDPALAETSFARMGNAIADTLNVAGVPYCKGGIMASHPAWRMSRKAWSGRVARWLAGGKPDDFLHADIFFDARHVHGDASLTDGLLAEARAAAAHAEVFLKFLGLNAARFRSALGLFGRIRTKDGRVDLKIAGTLPINGAARALALRHGISAVSTPTRLAALAQAGQCPTRLATNLTDAHHILLALILEQQLRDMSRGILASNRVALNELSRHQRHELTWALEQTAAVSDVLGVPPT
jgi:DNA polymerase-3 subunit epsilon/CBS domain-containing protein